MQHAGGMKGRKQEAQRQNPPTSRLWPAKRVRYQSNLPVMFRCTKQGRGRPVSRSGAKRPLVLPYRAVVGSFPESPCLPERHWRRWRPCWPQVLKPFVARCVVYVESKKNRPSAARHPIRYGIDCTHSSAIHAMTNSVSSARVMHPSSRLHDSPPRALTVGFSQAITMRPCKSVRTPSPRR